MVSEDKHGLKAQGSPAGCDRRTVPSMKPDLGRAEFYPLELVEIIEVEQL